MIDLWYLNISNINQSRFDQLVRTLPNEMVNEIMRFRIFKDRCLKLFGRLIVKKYYLDHNLLFKWSDWMISPNGKPTCTNGKKFSISHSGNYVSVAFSDLPIGLDIEELSEFEMEAVIEYLHPSESIFVRESDNIKDAFFSVWTRKEAYLKAKGVGIVQGLNLESCLEPSIITDEQWFLEDVNLFPNYKMAVCLQEPIREINKRKMNSTEFLNL